MIHAKMVLLSIMTWLALYVACHDVRGQSGR